MEFNRKQLSSILEVLRETPRGMNVTEVAKESGMNRSTVAKYLEMLFVSGHVDMRSFGTSKVYYISQRMPISAFLNFTSDLIIVVDKYSRVLNANDAFFEFTGIRREEVVHKNIDHFAFPLKFDPSIEPYISQAIHGTATTIESYYLKENKGYYFNVKLIPLVFDDGEKGVTIIFEDITEKKLAEKALRNSKEELEIKVRERTLELEKANVALRESEERYRVLIEKSFDVVFSVKPDGTIVYVSPQISHYGYDADKLNHTNFFQYIPPAYQGFLAQKFKEVLTNGESTPTEFKLLDKDGREHWAEVTAKTIYDDEIRPLFMVGTVRDINERKLVEEKLAENERFLRNVFECIQEGISVLDKDLNIVRVNPTMEKRYGPNISGSKCYAVYQGRSTPCEICPSIKAIREKTTQKEIVYDLRGWSEIYAFPLIDENGEVTGVIEHVRDINERKRAEEALRDSESRFKALFEGSSVGVFIIDLGTRIITDCNTYATQMTGRPKEELIGMHHMKLHPPESAEPCRRNSMIHTKDGHAMNYETEILHKDGRRIPILINSTILELGGKKVMMGSYLDITERKRAEEALRESEARFNQVLDSLTDSFMILDSKWRCLYVNEATVNNAGMSKEQLIGRTIWELYPQSVISLQYEQSMMTMEDKIPRTWINRSSVNDIWYEYRAYPWEDGIVMFARDITESKRAEEALHDSEEKFRALADSSSIGILLIQGEDIIYANLAIADMYGYTIGEVLKMKYWDPVPPEMKEYIRERITLRQRGEPGPSRTELKMVKKNGEFIWLDCTAAMLQYGGKPAIMLTTMDITARKMMERELIKSEEKLRSLVENINDIVWEVDENKVCTYISPRSREILGYEPEELIGKTPFTLMVPEEVPRVRGLVKTFLDVNMPFELFGYWVVKKDGSKVLLETSGMPIFDEQGRLIGYRGVHRDITNGRR